LSNAAGEQTEIVVVGKRFRGLEVDIYGFGFRLKSTFDLYATKGCE
jgi:hypothetical protein